MSLSKRPPGGDAELSAEDEQLLRSVRLLRSQERAPSLVRQRLLARLVEEARQGDENIAVPAELVPVRGGASRSVTWVALAAALCVLLLASARRLFGDSSGPTAVGPERRGAASLASERLLGAPLFRAPAQRASASDFSPSVSNLLGGHPFSAQSGGWQVRRWNDLSADPVEPAAHDFAEGALCVVLGPGERVLGGWPWEASDVATSDVPRRAVAISSGKAYRLSFKAWAREPLPQFLIAVGHAGAPFSAAAGARVAVSTEPQPFVVEFLSSRNDPSVGVAFLVTSGEGSAPTRVCVSDVTLAEREH